MLDELFKGWARSDWFAATAIAISLMSAVFSAYQARLAAKRLKLDETAQHPLVEASHGSTEIWPGWHEQQICVRNRFEDTLYVDEIVVTKPRRAQIMNAIDKYAEYPVRVVVKLHKEPPLSRAGQSADRFPRISPLKPEWMSIIINGANKPAVDIAVRMSRGSQRDQVLTQTLKIKLPIDTAKAT